MATRKQYPSDHRRWFRVTEDILDDPGYRNLSAINQAVWIDILATFNRQQAHRQKNCIVLPWRSAMLLMRAKSIGGVSDRVRKLSVWVGASAARVPEGLLVMVPKWSKMQGITPTWLRCPSDATPTTSTTPTPSTPYSPPVSGKRPEVKPKPRRERKPQTKAQPTPFPDDTTDLEAGVRAWVREHSEHSSVSVPRALEIVGDWARSNAKRKTDWLATVRNAIRQGWAIPQTAGAPDRPNMPSARRESHKMFDFDEQARLIEGDVAALVKRAEES